MEHLYEKAQQSAEFIRSHMTKRPKIAVVLGSGLGNLTADFTETEELPYRDIPNFPVSTVEGHKGALLAGKLGEKEVYALEGRFHFYEGYSMKEVCYPFYVLKLLGVEQVVLTNACGGINRSFAPGTLMLITDFISSHKAGAHGREAIQAFAQIPLLMACLQVASTNIIDDGITKDILLGFLLGHTLAVLPQYYTQLTFIIKAIHQALVGRHKLLGSRSTTHTLRKIDGIRTFTTKGFVRKTTGLLGMSIIVDT